MSVMGIQRLYYSGSSSSYMAETSVHGAVFFSEITCSRRVSGKNNKLLTDFSFKKDSFTDHARSVGDK